MNLPIPCSRATVIAGVVMIVHLVARDTVEAQCSLGHLWANPMPIKVQINTRIDEDLCPNSTCSSFADIRRTTEAAFNEYYQATAGKIRFIYAGVTSEEPHTVIDDHIHIFADDCSGGTLGIAASGETWGKIGCVDPMLRGQSTGIPSIADQRGHFTPCCYMSWDT